MEWEWVRGIKNKKEREKDSEWVKEKRKREKARERENDDQPDHHDNKRNVGMRIGGRNHLGGDEIQGEKVRKWENERKRKRKRMESKWWVLWTPRYNDTLSSDTYTFYSHSDCVKERVREEEKEREKKINERKREREKMRRTFSFLVI